MGVHRADTEERRARRAAFVEAVIAGVRVLDFTTEVARVHAQLGGAGVEIADLHGDGEVVLVEDRLGITMTEIVKGDRT